MKVSPARATLRGRVDRGSVEELQCHLCSVLLGIVDVLPIIPISSGDVLTLNGDGAGPRRTSTCGIVSELNSKVSRSSEGSLPRLSDTIWKTGGWIWASRHFSSRHQKGHWAEIVTALPSSLSCQVPAFEP